MTRAIFQNRTVPFLQKRKKLKKTFAPYVTIWLVRIWTYKNADEKEHFFMQKKKRSQMTKEDEK